MLGLTGAFYSSYYKGVSPSIFDFGKVLLLFAMMVVGGMGSARGVLLGTALLLFVDQHWLSAGPAPVHRDRRPDAGRDAVHRERAGRAARADPAIDTARAGRGASSDEAAASEHRCWKGESDVSDVTFGISPECLCHDVRDNVARVQALEEAGFQYIWEGDHTLPWQHSSGHSAGIFATLTAFLSRTERAVVGGMVIPRDRDQASPDRRRGRDRDAGAALSGSRRALRRHRRGDEREDDDRVLAAAQGADRALHRGDRADQEGAGRATTTSSTTGSTSRASSTSTRSRRAASPSCAPPRARSWRGTPGSTRDGYVAVGVPPAHHRRSC